MIKRGSKVRVVKMDTAGGMDWQAKRLEGKVFTVRFIDSAGQIQNMRLSVECYIREKEAQRASFSFRCRETLALSALFFAKNPF